MIDAGSVNTHAISRLRTVDHCRPDPLAAIVPATPDDNTCVVETGSPYEIRRANGGHRDQFSRGALRVSQVRLAYLFADRHDDPLPADHRAEAERDGNGDFNPERDEACRAVERLLESGQLSDCRRG